MVEEISEQPAGVGIYPAHTRTAVMLFSLMFFRVLEDVKVIIDARRM